MSDYLIFTATEKSNNNFLTTPIYQSMVRLPKEDPFIPHNTLIPIYNNKKSLSQLYNEAIKRYTHYNIIFCHDDLYIEDAFVFDKLEEAFKTHDIIGLAGTEKVNYNKDILSWFDQEYIKKGLGSGLVNHLHEGKRFPSYYGEFGKDLEAIDGLFMAVNPKKLIENDVFFDPQFDFHFYDLDFCKTAKKKELKITTSPINTLHLSIGEGVLKEKYKKLNQKFKEKWGL